MVSPSLPHSVGQSPFWDGALDLRVSAASDAHDARSIVVPFDVVAHAASDEPARSLDITLHRDSGVDVLVHRLGPGATVHLGRHSAAKIVFVARGLGRVQTGRSVVDVAAEQTLDAGIGAVSITAGREGATAIIIAEA